MSLSWLCRIGAGKSARRRGSSGRLERVVGRWRARRGGRSTARLETKSRSAADSSALSALSAAPPARWASCHTALAVAHPHASQSRLQASPAG